MVLSLVPHAQPGAESVLLTVDPARKRLRTIAQHACAAPRISLSYIRSTSARVQGCVPMVRTAAVPAATPSAKESSGSRPCARPNVIAAKGQGDHVGRPGIDEPAYGLLLIARFRKLPADQVLQFPEARLDEVHAAFGGLAQRVAGRVENELHLFARGNGGDLHKVVVRDAPRKAAACDKVFAFDLFQSSQACLPLRLLEDRALGHKPVLKPARPLVHGI